MRNNRKERNAFHSPSYWQSYSDMMAALLLIFILIIAITLAIYKQKQTDLRLQNSSSAVPRQILPCQRKN